MTLILSTKTEEFGLGRKQAEDVRDQGHMMRTLLPRQVPPKIRRKNWTCGPVLNQGSTPRCVGHAWYALLLATPIADTPERLAIPSSISSTIWQEAQKVDEWPGEDPDDGTSVRAGGKVLSDPLNVFTNPSGKVQVKRYIWAFDLETVINWILTRGPMVVGFDWMGDMFKPDHNGLVKATGSWEGGHAFLYRGVDMDTRLFRFRNSWGANWGKDGDAFISFDDTRKLLASQGEACTAVEQRAV